MLYGEKAHDFFLAPYNNATEKKVAEKISEFMSNAYNAKVKKCDFEKLDNKSSRFHDCWRIDVYLEKWEDFKELVIINNRWDYTVVEEIEKSVKEIIISLDETEYFSPFEKFRVLLKSFFSAELGYIHNTFRIDDTIHQFINCDGIKEILTSTPANMLFVLFDTRENMDKFKGSETEKRIHELLLKSIKEVDIHDLIKDLSSDWHRGWYHYQLYDVYYEDNAYWRQFC